MKLLTDEFLELLLDAPSETQPSRKASATTSATDREHSEKTKRTKGDGDGDREAA